MPTEITRATMQVCSQFLPSEPDEEVVGCPETHLEIGDEVEITGRFYIAAINRQVGKLEMGLRSQGVFNLKLVGNCRAEEQK